MTTNLDQKNSDTNQIFDNELNIKDLFKVILEGKKIILFVTSAFAILSVIYALSLTNIYRSDALLMGAESQETGGLSQYSGLASLAGIGLTNSADGVGEIIEIIQSRAFVKHLITFEGVLESMMAAGSYDDILGDLSYDPEIFNEENGTWNKKPSYLKTHKAYLGEILSISQDLKTGFVSISVEHISPIFAKDFLALVIKEANALKREKDIETSNKALSYLKIELAKTPLVEIRASISKLIQAQLETQMRAKITEEYSLVVLEPPFIPEVRAKPNRVFICILGTMLGGILSIIFLLFRNTFFRG